MQVFPLIDAFGRLHDNLRISVTDRCNIRCFFCMPEHDVDFLPRAEILTFEEIERFARLAVQLGARKIRLTGGEPLLRRGLPALVAKLAAINGLRDLALTTNGIGLKDQAADLRRAGLRRINIHLDTLDRQRFITITRRDELRAVLAGIEESRRVGFSPIKLNVVAVKGLVEPDIIPLAHFGRENGLEIRYIEFMPLDGRGLWLRDKVLLAEEIRAMLEREFGPLHEIPDEDPRMPAVRYGFADGVGSVGFVASVSRPFCLSCNRIRLTADGKLRYCLFAHEETDVKSLLRGSATDEEIREVIRTVVAGKWLGHDINAGVWFVPPPRPMYAIGG